MAISFVGAAVGSATGSSFSVAKADITGLQDGDLVVAIVGKFDDDGGDFSGPTGWTLTDQQTSTTGDDQRSCYAYKYLTDVASEPTTWDFSVTVTDPKGAVVAAFRGVDSTTPIDATATTTLGTSDMNPAAPDITTVTNGAFVVVMVTLVNGTAVLGYTGGAPSGFTLADDVGVDNGTAEFFAALAYKEQASAGLVSPGVWTNTGSGTPEWSSRSIALKPATAGGDATIAVPAATVSVAAAVPTPVIVIPQALATVAVAAATSTPVVAVPPPVGTVAVAAFEPSFVVSSLISVPTGAVSLAGLEPTVVTDPFVLPPAATVTVEAPVPTPALTVPQALATVSVAALAPTPALVIQPGAAAVAVAALLPSVEGDAVLVGLTAMDCDSLTLEAISCDTLVVTALDDNTLVITAME